MSPCVVTKCFRATDITSSNTLIVTPFGCCLYNWAVSLPTSQQSHTSTQDGSRQRSTFLSSHSRRSWPPANFSDTLNPLHLVLLLLLLPSLALIGQLKTTVKNHTLRRINKKSGGNRRTFCRDVMRSFTRDHLVSPILFGSRKGNSLTRDHDRVTTSIEEFG